MKSGAAWSTEISAEIREALAAVTASVAALAAVVDDGVEPADPLRSLADSYLDALAETARGEARMAALKVRLTAEYTRAAGALASPAGSPQECTAREMSTVAELACALTVSERAAGALISDALALTSSLPLALEALQSGTISWQHARIMVDETANLEPAGAAALEAHFLDPDAPQPARGCAAGELVPGRFRAKARTWRERHHPVSIETRHTKSSAERRVEYCPDRDGMAWLSAYLPADTAAGIWDRITAAARAQQGPTEPRTLPQLRADTAATWLLTTGTANDDADGAPGHAGAWLTADVPVPRAQVLITVPVMALLGATDEPAVLDGHGPIPPSIARRLISDGADSFHRVLTDPRDGAPLEIGRTSYRVPKALRQWLRLRDGKCPFPGCHNASLDNDADHLLAWADGGTTGITNLGQPCRKHHRLKHTTAWTPTPATKNHPPGWTSPTGRTYPSEHQDWEPPHWPGTTLAADPLFGSGPPPHPAPGVEPDPSLHDPDEPCPYPEVPDDADQVPDQCRGPGPGPDLPPDPFPDWHLCAAA
ncbi:DUF222 domain-containing protein [Arthrobacter sp. UKPF54-2]|uniref:HNH endonuclease signature motif containing protein n=1 Tax=Arthrobacter sp. UKPF54-2 TaxID=2600159 RepID=UPI0011B1C1DE|nr:HNH endonuclease signature motif containing protein [Arthrobacter sp. UKPF54-2]QDY90935.1 DUF222 domain-containing protein [Arthrobacter sp. UKPF54-2]